MARACGGIVLDSSGGCVLPDTALFGPDSAYIGPERWDALTPAQQEEYFQGAPDAAFEIVSQSDSRTEQLEKAEAYARNGSTLVVLIDPYRRAVDVWRGAVHEALGDAASVVCDPVMPDFVLNVSAIQRV